MKHISTWSLLAFALLAGCKPAPSVTGGSPPADAPAPAASDARPVPVPTAEASAASIAATGPSFDCDKATSDFERLVCDTPGLAALDRQLAATFRQAMDKSTDRATLLAGQRGWIKGRDDCWKAEDKQACVHDAYVQRIVDLRIQNGLVVIPAHVEFRCDDAAKRVAATFYNDEPRAMVLTVDDDQVIVPAAISGSGARYATDGVEFWEHQGDASITFYGTKLACKTMP